MENKNILYKIKEIDILIIRQLLEHNSDERKLFMKKPLPPTQMQIIEYILEHIEEKIYQKDLEKVLKLRRATVSGVLQTMEKNGLIKRVVLEEDIRAKEIILNDKTRDVFLANQKKLMEIEKTIIYNIDENDLKVFSKVLDNMKNNIENMK